ncbi:antibiotic biosynthesis monooxygenase [Psittacicella gerlachiana]|uniref:antibiotic biosynthesis monooxygenase n=1 Tax=Psittacicella gerlachiana TaxID=2028574 RepID=UPI001CA7A77F|nr:antibiotic biosynthesis monooxygenase [Psittacicella gerlachiana]
MLTFFLLVCLGANQGQATSNAQRPYFVLNEISLQEGALINWQQVNNYLTEQAVTQENALAILTLQANQEPNLVLQFEVYPNLEAYQAYLEHSEYQEFQAQAPSLLTNKQTIKLAPQYIVTQGQEISNPYVAYSYYQVATPYLTEFRDGLLLELETAESKPLLVYAANRLDNPRAWYLVQVFADLQAYEQWQQSTSWQAFVAKASPMLEQTTVIPVQGEQILVKGNFSYNSLEDSTPFVEKIRD